MTGGLAVSLLAAGLAAVVHVVIFVLESLLFTRPAVRRLFGVRSADDSAPLRVFARNQGVYNLGLALVVAVGVVLILAAPWGERAGAEHGAIGAAVLVAGCAVMLLAALTLVATAPRLWRAALVQGAPPLVAIGALLLLGSVPLG
ncbi:MAG: DUF1304 domain-containing protein [Actinobacteria bacterium]|nr:DUF1304 domain-containing protein [Actinomycetota bacterium]MBU1608317.1 DUF1304 domain-containing protein [Actinomycetota bacterium]MBU2316821.1 DUF1304 domain-containing protein [Actinomycetota bacterium]MBU2385964.1 DUF1304 domain-containing protein [Actinomycetota bacterium]